MLSQDILNALKSYAAKLERPVSLVLQTGQHEKRAELLEFLNQICSVSELLEVHERDAGLRSPISFALEADHTAVGIEFSGIPSGHEFNSLVLAILQAGGSQVKLDPSLVAMLERIDQPTKFEVFISLSCHNCPDVVQALNQFALINPNIQTEMIDGGLFQDVIEARNIQGVPSVYLNGEIFANGKVETGQLIEKLVAKYPHIAKAESVESLPVQDVTVLGGGPAGVSAAIYAARKGLKVTVIAERLGGQVKDTVGIENFISVQETTGTQLTGNLVQHLTQHDVTVKEHLRVRSVEPGDIKSVTLSNGEIIQSKTVIVATGAKWRELGVPGEKENIGSGVAYCPHCDGPFFKGKDVAVVGGGNSGIEAALDLAGMVNHVTVFEFAPTLKADQVLIDKAEAHDRISIIKNAQTTEVIANGGKVSGLRYVDRESGQQHQHDVAGIFVQIGLVPNSEFLKGVVELSPHGEVVIDEHCQTSQQGIFAAGDVSTVPFKQIVIAVGEGSKASLSAFDHLIRAA